MNFLLKQYFVFMGMVLVIQLQYWTVKLDKTALGIISSSSTIFYEVSKFVLDDLNDSFGENILIASGVCCLLFPLTSNALILALTWGICGYMKGFGWPSCTKISILRNWYALDEIATW